MFVLAAALAVLFFFWMVIFPHGEELSEIKVESAAYCALFSREMVRIDIMHGPSLTADTDYILARAKEHYAACLAILPTLLPLPEEGSLKSWLADTRDLLILIGREKFADAGTEPAKENPSDAEWRAQCAREYATWNEADGTVVRKGNPEPVRCPCGGEVICE
jgi:hypothetical protein